MGSILSYNIAGLISEVSEEVATQIATNCRRQQPHSHLRSPRRGSTPASMCIYLIFPETRVIGLHFCRCMYGSISVSSFIFVQWAPKDASFLQKSAPECVLAVQGHPRSMILVPIESAHGLPISRSL